MNICHVTIFSVTGLEFRQDEQLSFQECQMCNQTNCTFISCKRNIQNYKYTKFCIRQHVTTIQPSSQSSMMVKTSMETNTSQNEPVTSSSYYVTRYTTEQEKVSEIVSASQTALRIGKFQCAIYRIKHVMNTCMIYIYPFIIPSVKRSLFNYCSYCN